jgi:uncharacterized protein
MNKQIHFGITTNCTLVTDEVVQFWKTWGIGFHTSVDGIPEIQDRNRPTCSGLPSSPFVEKAIPQILSYRAKTTARCTIAPDTLYRHKILAENYLYFRNLGYTKIAMIPSDAKEWDEMTINKFDKQFREVIDIFLDDFRRGHFVELSGINDYFTCFQPGEKKKNRKKIACGAGRGMVLVDIHGDLWPCHRWNRKDEVNWKIGSIYNFFSEKIRQL